MKIIKRIFAFVIMLPALLVFLGMVGGIAGSWAINNAITQAGIDVLIAGSDFVDGTQQTISQVETLLLDAQTVMIEVEDEVERIGADVTASTDILDDISNLLGVELDTVISDVEAFFTSVQQTALAFANALDAIRRLPMLADTEIAKMDQNIFRDVAEEVEALSNQINNLLDLVNSGKDGLTEEIVTEINDTITQLDTTIDSLLSQISTIYTDLTALQTDLTGAQNGWSQVVDAFTIMLTIFFIFMALAFLSLFLHSLAYFIYPDHSLRSLIPLEGRN